MKVFNSIFSSSVWTDKPLLKLSIKDIKQINFQKKKQNHLFVLNIIIKNGTSMKFASKDYEIVLSVYNILDYLIFLNLSEEFNRES